MTDLTFLSHVARGFGAMASALGTDDQHKLSITLDVTGQPSGETHALTQQVAMSRPCDVAGVVPGAIFRTDPDHRGMIENFEPNYLACIEFAAIDLPWRFSTARETSGRRAPWLALIVLAKDEFSFFAGGRGSDGAVRLPRVRIDEPARVLPPSDQLGAWAHGQVAGDLGGTATGDDLSALDGADLTATRSRLIAARRLAPKVEYFACLVPTTECGRLRGLDPDAPHDHVTGPAWSNSLTGPLDLPLYFHWRFATAGRGDLESMARQLSPHSAGADAGWRDMHVAAQAYGIPAAILPQRLGSALVAPEPVQTSDQPEALTLALTAALNAPDNLATNPSTDLLAAPALAPPLYGQVAAQTTRVLPDAGDVSPPISAQDTPWFHQLNNTLVHRAAAGLGVDVVRRNQEPLVAEAWRQVGALDQADRKINQAQFGLLASTSMHTRVFTKLAPEALLMLTRPTHAALRHPDDISLAQDIADSAIGRLVASPKTRAALAKRGALRAALARDTVNFEPYTALATLTQSDRSPPRSFEKIVHDPALAAVLTADGATTAAPAPQPANLMQLADEVRAALQPKLTLPPRVDAQIGGLDVGPDLTALNPPGPEFDTPMFAPLRDISVSHLFAGLGDMPAESVALLGMNTAFIEAYFAGLNHEMGRELLWRGFPVASLGATFFRQFWERGGAAPDIPSMDSWTAPLGENVSDRTELALMIRSGLIQRYPGIMIYACRAEFQDGRYHLAPDIAEPLFRAELTAETLAIGFALTSEQVIGFVPGQGIATANEADARQADPGWFFVFEEQPKEPRFGLDVPGSGGHGNEWSNVNWAHAAPAVAANPDAWDGAIDLAAANASVLPTDPPWNGSAADVAAAFMQKPFRIAVHGARLLPPPDRETE